MQDLNYYKTQGFDNKQLKEIELGLEYNVDVSIYAKSELSSD